MVLEIDNITKKYGDLFALNKLSLTLENGLYGILGQNGAGKSTLMSIMTMNLKADGGEIRCDGKNIISMGKDYRRLVGYMPQEQVCYPQFTAVSFLRYMALLKGLNIKEQAVRDQIDELIDTVHLSDVKNRKISTYSGGMKRRIILAQAFLGNPKLVILDEPTAGMDPRERISIRNLISQLSKDRIILLSTHIASDIECIADHVILMKKGRVIKNEKQNVLLEEVSRHIEEKYIDLKQETEIDLGAYSCNIYQKNGKMVMHVLTEGENQESCKDVTMDDVYLYYMDVVYK